MTKLNAIAYHLTSKVSLKEAVPGVELSEIKSDRSFALLSAGDLAWVYLKSYGGVVFINCDEQLIEKVMRSIVDAEVQIDQLPSEDYVIEVDAAVQFHVDFSVIRLPEISDDIAHVIMLNLSQSAALEDFHENVRRLLALTKSFSDQLDKTGRFKLSRRAVRKYIGQTMVLKNKISESLFIYETPDVAWSDKNLAQLDEQMRIQLELEKRHEGLQLDLSVVKENLDVYRDILQHRHSSTLEWIIILLILFEVIQVIIEKS